MNIVCDNRSLSTAVAACVQVVRDAPDRPVLKCVRLSTEGDRLEVLGSDRETWVRQVVAGVEVKHPGVCLVPARDLLRWLQASPQGRVSVTAHAHHILAECGGRQRFDLYPAVEYPEPDPTRVAVPRQVYAGVGDDNKPLYKVEFEEQDNAPVADVVVPTSSLLAAVARVAFCASKKDTHRNFALTGVLVEVGDLRLTFAACDDRHLGFTTIETARPAVDGKAHAALVPAALLAKLPQAVGGESEVTVSVGDNGIAVRGDRSEVGGRLLHGRFPDFRRLAALSPPVKGEGIVVPTLELFAKIKQITAIAVSKTLSIRRRGSTLEISVPIACEFSGDDRSGELSSDTMSCSDGPDFELALYAPDVLEMLYVARAQGSEEVTLYPPRGKGRWVVRPTPGGWDYFPPLMASYDVPQPNGGDK